LFNEDQTDTRIQNCLDKLEELTHHLRHES
jgi:hypothetical protein